MAFKSPGIYFTEIDNTEYANPAAEVNTTVAIIGFAKKGPIGVPTEITSYNEYKEIFGSPISGQYAGLAVRSVLSSGGTVLYTRIADTTLASKSSVILKTSTPKSDGKLVVNSKDDITVGTEGYENGKIYTGLLSDSTGKKTKTLVVRTPAKSKLSLSNMLTQLNNSLKENYGFTEYKIKNFSSSYRNFSLEIGGYTIDKESGEKIKAESKTYGPYYIQTYSNDKEILAETINSVLSKGTNPYQKFSLKLNFDENGSILLSDTQRAKKYFRVKFEDSDVSTLCLDLSKISENSIQVSELVSKFNDALNNSGINVEYYIDSSNIKYLLFVSTNNTNFEILPAIEDEDTISKDTLFIPCKEDGSDIPSGVYAVKSSSGYVMNNTIAQIDASENLLFGYNKAVISQYTTESDLPAIVEYNSNTETLKFIVNNNINTNIQVESSKISVKKPLVGSCYLFDSGASISTDTDKEYSARDVLEATNNKGNVGYNVFSLLGETASNIEVARKNGQLYFSEKNVLIPPSLTDLSEDAVGNTLSLTYLLGKNIGLDSFVESNLKEGSYRCLLQYPGTVEIPSYKNDMVIFTSKEYGSGTTNIGIEIYTTTSPFADENGNFKKTHYIDLYVNGIKKESWENVSYNRKDDNYFVNLINKDADNGGSAYVTVYGKQIAPNLELNVPDTSELTSSGIIYLGRPIDENSIEKTDDVNVSAYNLYDYNVGNDGIPDETADLFVEVMDKYESGLSNKDLYSWHILITPDNITQGVQTAAIELCEYMEDAIYIADPPQGLSRKGVVDWHNGKSTYRDTPFDSNYVCTYWPWCKVYDSSLGEYTWVMPSVIMAAQFCKVDKNYAPWYAPAGETNGYLSTVLDIEELPNKTDRDAMYLDQNRVNPLLKLRNGNILAYGEKTTQRKNSTLTKIHTRRMLIALKKELRAAIKGFIFQPTAAANISKINANVTSIMESYKSGGGIASYNVICDGTNNTTETLQQDILNVAISCVPVGCIEQVEITFTLNKSE